MQVVENKLNGIKLDQFHATVRQGTAVPPSVAAGFSVLTRWMDGVKSESHVRQWSIGGERRKRSFVIACDEPPELLGDNGAPNPQEYLMTALNACMMVGYVVQCALRGIELESLEIETEGEIDLRAFLGIDPSVTPGYEQLGYTVRIKGNGTAEQFEEIHRAVMATSPNFWNVSRPIAMNPRLVVET